MGSETTTLPLLLATRPRKDDTALPELIRRINADRGHLRNVTEESLKEEIAKGEHEDSADSVDKEDSSQTAGDVESQQKQLYEAKATLLKHIEQAEEQALLALDFISFLMKKDAPRQAEQTISPALKQLAPLGNLAFDKLPVPKPSPADVRDDNFIATGWSLQALNTSADALLASATKLEDEIRKETNYWDDVLSVRENGWSVCRVPNRKNALAVRYGFLEASPVFQSRSMAVMHQDNDGHVTLDSNLTRDPKVLRVRILQDGKAIRDSYTSTPASANKDISARILRARDSLFEEELYYELDKESRTLINHGVRIVKNSIHVPLASVTEHGLSDSSRPSYHVQLSLQPLRRAPAMVQVSSSETEGVPEANAIATALRLLLTFTHRQRFRERSRPPPPMSDQKQPMKTTNILRTMLTYIQHRNAASGISKYIDSVGLVLRLAGLEATFLVREENGNQVMRAPTPMEGLARLLSGPWMVVYGLKLPNDSQLIVRISTSLDPPSFGSSFLIQHMSSAGLPLGITNTSFETATEAIAHASLSIRAALLEQIKVYSDQDWSLGREVGHGLSEAFVRAARSKRLLLGLGQEGNSLVVASAPTASDPDRPLNQVKKCAWALGRDQGRKFEDVVKQIIAP